MIIFFLITWHSNKQKGYKSGSESTNMDLIKVDYISEATICTHVAIIHWLSTIYCIQSVKRSISPGPAQDGDKPHLLLNTICYCLSISLPLCVTNKHLKNHMQTNHTLTAMNSVKWMLLYKQKTNEGIKIQITSTIKDFVTKYAIVWSKHDTLKVWHRTFKS